MTDDQKALITVDCMRYGTEIMRVMFSIADYVDEGFVNGKWDWHANKQFRAACESFGISEGKLAKSLHSQLDCKLFIRFLERADIFCCHLFNLCNLSILF